MWIAQPRLVVELGTYSGYSAQFMARALPPGGRVITCELSPERAAFAQERLREDGVEIRLGPGLDTLATIDEPVDLAFIDADKDGYIDYYEALVPKLSERGLIVADNTLPGYVLPALPAILLLLARHYPALSERARRAPAVACIASGLALGLLAAVLPHLDARLSWTEFDAHYAIWLLAAGLVLSAAGLTGLRFQRRASDEASIAVVGLGSLLAVQIALSGTHVLDEHYSSERIMQAVVGEKLRFPRELPFYSVASFDQSVPFYLGRPVTLVRYKDELAPGIATEPWKFVSSVEEFVELWQEHAEAFAIMTPPFYEKLRQQGLPGRVLARDARRVIVARR